LQKSLKNQQHLLWSGEFGGDSTYHHPTPQVKPARPSVAGFFCLKQPRLPLEMRGGHDYEANFASHMKGRGLFAALVAQRFQLALKRYGLQKLPATVDVSQFRPPCQPTAQSALF
jgi:hypothetical protein